MLSFILHPQRIQYVIFAGILACGIWYGVNFVQEKNAAERQVAVLTDTVSARDLTIKTMVLQAAQKEQALKVADAARTVLENLKDGYDDLRLSIAATPSSEDAPVAPVLRHALDALGGL